MVDSSGGSDVGEDAVERPRHPAEVQGLDEQGRGLDLPAAVGAEEAAELLLGGPSLPGGLFLEGAERSKLAASSGLLGRGGSMPTR
jgi:hypothetical protein